jgi:hypothetical protein
MGIANKNETKMEMIKITETNGNKAVSDVNYTTVEVKEFGWTRGC